jgi:hypothetical protein
MPPMQMLRDSEVYSKARGREYTVAAAARGARRRAGGGGGNAGGAGAGGGRGAQADAVGDPNGHSVGS